MTQPPESQPPPKQIKTAIDNQNQFDRIKPYVLDDEILYAVYDCKGTGTGFVGVTDRRVIFYDQGMFLNKSKKMISIPFNRVIGVSTADEGVVFKTSEITLITAAGNFSFEFRSPEKANWVYRHICTQILTQAHPQLPG